MALLVFSDKCPYCQEVLKFVQGEPSLQPILRFWNVTAQGVPHKKVTRVPTLVTDEGKMMVGSEVKAWLESMIPTDVSSFDNSNFTFNLDGSDSNDMIFNMDKYGESLEPRMTAELRAKISSDPTVAYQKRSNAAI
jgi:hypothetical protein